MRWIKVIAIVIGVIVVFGIISALMHALLWIGVGIVIAVLVGGALKARSLTRGGQRRPAAGKPGARAAEAAPARPELDVPAAQPQLEARAKAAQRQQDVEDELARLKREMQ
jgi:hypothetical protein